MASAGQGKKIGWVWPGGGVSRRNGLAALLLLEKRNHPAATAIGREREERDFFDLIPQSLALEASRVR